MNHEQVLEKLEKLEDKLKVLSDYSQQSYQLRSTRKKVLENLMNLKNEIMAAESKTALEEKRVKFVEESDNDTRKSLFRSMSINTPSLQVMQRSKSLQELLTNLHNWHGEVKQKKSEIELLKTRMESFVQPKESVKYDKEIARLEEEKEELDEKILLFILRNISEGKDEYINLISHLEDENRDMEKTIIMLYKIVGHLKETNIALMRENEHLRRSSGSISLETLEQKYRKSMSIGRYSSMLPEMSLLDPSSLLKKSSSIQFLLDMAEEDKISLDRESADSFNLDMQIATWKIDDESMHKSIKRLEEEFHEMQVTQMKLNLIKRFIRKHGTKRINRNTLIDPSEGSSLW